MPEPRPTAAELRRRLEELARLEARAGGTYPIIDQERRRLERQLAEAEETSMGEQPEARTNGHGYSTHTFTRPNGHDAGEPQAPPDWPMLTYGDAIEAKPAPYLVKGLVNRGEFSAWYGPPKAGKSFALLDLELHIAAGRPWRGRRVRQGRVLHLALEGGGGIANRLVAAQTKFGRDRLPFHVLAVPVDLLGGDGDRLLAFINAKLAELGGAFDLIVFDTLSRAMPGANENSAETMTAVIAVLDRLRAATGAHVAIVHHVGKDGDRGMRGHSSLLGAVDLAVEIKDGLIRITDARDCPEGAVWGFDLDAVQIGTDDDGDPIFSCIVRELAEGEEPRTRKKPKPGKPRPLGPVEKRVLDAFKAALVDIGKPVVEAGAVAREIP